MPSSILVGWILHEEVGNPCIPSLYKTLATQLQIGTLFVSQGLKSSQCQLEYRSDVKAVHQHREVQTLNKNELGNMYGLTVGVGWTRRGSCLSIESVVQSAGKTDARVIRRVDEMETDLWSLSVPWPTY